MKIINLKGLLKFMLLVFLLSGPSVSHGQNSNTYRVLFLGNSVFYYHGGLYEAFEGFCNEAGLDYRAASQRNTPQDPHGIEFLDYGRIPVNLPEMAADSNIHDLIRSGNFDYVILEGRRTGFLLPEGVDLPDERGQHIPYEENIEALRSIHQTIVVSGAKTVLYMHPGLHTTEDVKLPVAQIYQRLHTDLEKISIGGKQHGVVLVPALYLWMDGIRRYGVDGWYADKAHGNALARYASACMLYTFITGRGPQENKFNKLHELTQNWEGVEDYTITIVNPGDDSWIKRQVWLYYSTRLQ